MSLYSSQVIFILFLLFSSLAQSSGNERLKEDEQKTNLYRIQRWRQQQQNENVLNDSPISLEEETAPPETGIVPELSIEKGRPPSLSNKFLRRLSAQQLANQRAKLHRGGNLRGPVNFEEALQVTVPYGEELE
uniref:Uncharacterized protein n=1 Tax=Meloidogyne hapla TaxID=6305 RepID=A0A1I8B4S7_MELHA